LSAFFKQASHPSSVQTKPDHDTTANLKQRSHSPNKLGALVLCLDYFAHLKTKKKKHKQPKISMACQLAQEITSKARKNDYLLTSMLIEHHH